MKAKMLLAYYRSRAKLSNSKHTVMWLRHDTTINTLLAISQLSDKS